jgi:hypothetical protein
MTATFRAVLFAAIAASILAPGASSKTSAAPVNRCAPQIEGKLVVGKTIISTTGCWAGNPSKFAYQWLRCDEHGANCIRVRRATNASYTLSSTDQGNTMIVLVTAANADGATGPVNSKPSAIVSAAAAPDNKVPPSITGKAIVGELLLANPGTYTGGLPDKYTYTWSRCDKDGAKCTTVAGETNQTYTVRRSDVGATLRVVVKATNEFGADVATSDRTAAVTEPPVQVSVTTSMTASKSIVTCCEVSKLTGTVSTGKAGEPVTILGRKYGDIVSSVVGTTTSTEGGDWSFSVRPSIQTTYQAKTSTATGAPLTIRVHPRVGLGFQNRTFTTKVTGGSGATSFAGKIVWFQRKPVVGGSWTTLQKVVLDTNSFARFTAKLPRGNQLVRVYLPQSEAGAGYLDGVSHLKRFNQR